MYFRTTDLQTSPYIVVPPLPRSDRTPRAEHSRFDVLLVILRHAFEALSLIQIKQYGDLTNAGRSRAPGCPPG
jgi:hypothetical protein